MSSEGCILADKLTVSPACALVLSFYRDLVETKSRCTFCSQARPTDVRAMPSSAHHHYRSAPAHLLLVSATTAADAFFTAFPTRLASCSGGVQQRQRQRHSYPATATGGDDDYLAAEHEEGTAEDAAEELRDCVVVGAGVAGLAAAADLERAGSDFVLLEAGERRVCVYATQQQRGCTYKPGDNQYLLRWLGACRSKLRTRGRTCCAACSLVVTLFLLRSFVDSSSIAACVVANVDIG